MRVPVDVALLHLVALKAIYHPEYLFLRKILLHSTLKTQNLSYGPNPAHFKQAENGLQSRSSENGKTAVWHYGLKLQ